MQFPLKHAVGKLVRSPHTRLQLLLGSAAVLWALAGHAGAQGIMVLEQPVEDLDASKQPFLLPSQPTDVIEAIADFKRFSGRAEWEKAFKQLAKVTSADSKRLVADSGGVMLPTDVLLQQLLGNLPAAGKEAYRVFQDAEAKALLEKATGKDEQKHLEKLASQYLITSSGDVATDRLGDLYFQEGRFADAVRCWQTILKYRPESTLSRAQLLTKIGIALFRQGKTAELQEVQQTLSERHAAEHVVIAGKNVAGKDLLASLIAGAPLPASPAGSAMADEVLLTNGSDVLWQIPFYVETKGVTLRDQYGRMRTSDFVPPVALDDSRVYANFFGYDLSVDLKTGKLLWCSGKFYEIPKKTGEIYGSALCEYFGLAVGDNRVWSVMRNIEQMNNQSAGFKLIGRSTTDGKEVFDSTKVNSFKEWSMLGDPLFDGNRIYVAAVKTNQRRDMSILAIDAANGKLDWSTVIGSYKSDPSQNYYYQSRGSSPALLFAEGAIFVDTHAGSLLKLDPLQGQIRWGLNYETDPPNDGNRFSYYDVPTAYMAAPPVIANGVLYLKGMQSRRLYAIDPNGANVLWKRPVNTLSVVIGADDKRIYLGGEEVVAYDLKTRDMLWSFPVHHGTSWIRPILSRASVFQLTSRGIYEFDKTNGDLKHLYRVSDPNAAGGKLFVTPKALIAVSNLAITAYRLEEEVPASSPAIEKSLN